MLGFQPEGNMVTYTINIPVPPVQVYWGFGIAAMVVSLLFLVIAIWTRWSEKVDKITSNPGVYYLWFVIFWGVYTISFIKGVGAVIETSPPTWIEHTAFFFGFALFLYIPIVFFKYFPKKRRAF